MKNNIKNRVYFISAIILSLYVAFGTDYVCPWRRYLHVYCAGCGVTRMIKALIKFDFYQAFRYNQLFFILLIFIIIYLFYVIICKIRKINYYKLGDRFLWLLLILVVSYSVLRNIPIFSYLLPTKI